MSVNVTHIISGLGDGGAESVLTRLCLATQGRGCQHTVVSLTGRGRYGEALEAAGITVICLHMGSLISGGRAFLQLTRLLRLHKPDVVQTWMYHADLIGGIAARLAGIRALVWGLRNTAPVGAEMKRTTRMVVRCCGVLSRFVPRTIVVCAYNAITPHVTAGYQRKKMVVIQNGYDFEQYSQVRDDALQWRTGNKIEQDVPLIGMVARYSPQKDHKNLMHALSRLRVRGEVFQCVLIGQKMEESNHELTRSIESLELSRHVRLLGPRKDVPNAMRALQLHVLSSRIEGFPNVLAEAMAAGTPCVSTDVGDAEMIVAECGWLVPKEDAVALANAIGDALAELRDSPEKWHDRQSECRRHVRAKYGLDRMVEKYLTTWQNAAFIE